MRVTARPALSLVSGIIVAAVVAGFARGSQATATTTNHAKSKVVLRVAIDSSWQFMKTAKQWFEKQHPGVTVDMYATPGASYNQQIVQELSIAHPADVTVLEVGPGPYSTLVENHLLENLDSIWKKENLARVYFPPVRRVYTSSDGHHYAVSIDLWWGPQIYYRLDVLQKAGVTLPPGHRLTEAQFLNISSRLKREGYVPLAVDGKDDAIGFGYILSSLVESACGEARYLNMTANWKKSVPLKTKWTDSCAVKALQTLAEWNVAGVFGDSPALRDYATAQGLFASGKAAARMDASWFPNELVIVNKFTQPYTWRMIPAVQGGTNPRFQFVTQDSLGVTAKSQHKQLAKAFIDLVISKRFEKRQAYFNDIGGMPARSDIKFPPGSHAVTVGMRDAMSKLGVSTSLPYQVPYGTAAGALTVQVNAMLSGQQSVVATARALAAAVLQSRRGG
jgi:ABC-type glycerol-3-phosphate transport system substrate-binding protein